MNQPIKQLSRVTDNPRIEVLRYSSFQQALAPYSFYMSSIGHLEKAGEKSVIVLLSGVTLCLSLPYEELVQLLDRGCSPLDLKPYHDDPIIDAHSAPGIRMPDGTIYAGISPDTGRPMYAASADAPLCMDFNTAAQYAATLEAGARKGFRVPSINELQVIFNNRATIGGFSPRTDAYVAGHYWSSTMHDHDSGKSLSFLNGEAGDGYYLTRAFAVRCVCD